MMPVSSEWAVRVRQTEREAAGLRDRMDVGLKFVLWSIKWKRKTEGAPNAGRGARQLKGV